MCLILKGSICSSALLAAAMQPCHTCGCHERCIFIYTLYHSVWYSIMVFLYWLNGYVCKLITLYFISALSWLKPVQTDSGQLLMHLTNRNSMACCITSSLDFDKRGCVIQIKWTKALCSNFQPMCTEVREVYQIDISMKWTLVFRTCIVTLCNPV